MATLTSYLGLTVTDLDQVSAGFLDALAATPRGMHACWQTSTQRIEL